jgi:hypothetical protein
VNFSLSKKKYLAYEINITNVFMCFLVRHGFNLAFKTFSFSARGVRLYSFFLLLLNYEYGRVFCSDAEAYYYVGLSSFPNIIFNRDLDIPQ